MARRGAKAPSSADGLAGSSVSVVSGSIRTPDESDALDVKLSIWATEITMRADGAELGNWELSEVTIRAIDSNTFEFVAEGDQLIFAPDDPAAFGASSLVAGGSGREGRRKKKKTSDPASKTVAQDHSAPSDRRGAKRRRTDKETAPKLSRRERKAAERLAAEQAEAQGIAASIGLEADENAAAVRRTNVREADVPAPIGEIRIPGRDGAGPAVPGATALEMAPTDDPIADAATTDTRIAESTPTDRAIPDTDYATPEPPSPLPSPAGEVEAAPVELPEQAVRPRRSRQERRRRQDRLDEAVPSERPTDLPPHEEPVMQQAVRDEDESEPDRQQPNRMWIRALDVARKYDFLGLDRVPVNESLRGQDHQHTWDHRVAPSSGLGKHICTICGEIRR